jgi:4-diphosphocytidyl-2-C-methyl-D-erythritol kinase
VDGAAALAALNALWNLGLDDESLFMCALELGSDVPYCLQGGTMAATGRGERLKALPPLPESWFVLVSPPVEISAASVYGHPALTRNEQLRVDGRTPAFRDALQAFAEGKLADLMFNRMESAIAAIHPEVALIKDRLRDAGCPAAIVSGSGPTVLGLCTGREQAEGIAKSFGRPRATAVHTVPKSLDFNPRR